MDWLPIIGAVAGTGVFSAVVQGIINRRKIGADASQAISDAAASTVKGVTLDYERVRTELNAERTAREALERLVVSVQGELRQVNRRHEEREAAWAQHDAQQLAVSQAHVAFDVLAVAEIQRAIDAGYLPASSLPAVPPLRAPSILRAHPVEEIHDVVLGGVD